VIVEILSRFLSLRDSFFSEDVVCDEFDDDVDDEFEDNGDDESEDDVDDEFELSEVVGSLVELLPFLIFPFLFPFLFPRRFFFAFFFLLIAKASFLLFIVTDPRFVLCFDPFFAFFFADDELLSPDFAALGFVVSFVSFFAGEELLASLSDALLLLSICDEW
jgi:hypothetical protein